MWRYKMYVLQLAFMLLVSQKYTSQFSTEQILHYLKNGEKN